MAVEVIVEGHGEQDAVGNLLARLAVDLELKALSTFAKPTRELRVSNDAGIERAAERVRSRSNVTAMLVLRDDEDGCPKIDGPRVAELLRAKQLPFPTAVVLAYREYESLFLPCIRQMAGRAFEVRGGLHRPGLRPDAIFEGDFEGKRDVKGWLSEQMNPGKIYKPSTDQLPMTRMVDFATVRKSGLPWFGTLERALTFLDTNVGTQGLVYPA